MQPAPMLNRGMPVEVMKDFDTILLFGRLTTDGPSVLTVWRIPGEEDFPVCPPGSAVLVRGYDVRMDPVLLLGRVVGSTGVKCVVGDLKWIPYETKRKDVRYPLMPPAGVCALNEAEPELPRPCQLLNISPCGACIVAEGPFQVGRQICLQMELAGGTTGHAVVYRCQVVRATPRSGGQFKYGLLFTRMDEDSRGDLARNIQAIRERTEKKLLV